MVQDRGEIKTGRESKSEKESLEKCSTRNSRAQVCAGSINLLRVSKCVHASHTVSFNFVLNNDFLEYFSNDYDCESKEKKKKNIQMRSTEARVQMTARCDKRT